MASTRIRRTNAEIDLFDGAIRSITEKVQPATCRQIYYRAAVARLVTKGDSGYRLVCESLYRQRWGKIVPWDWIVDETRAVRAPTVWEDAYSGMEAFAATYRRDVWRSQPTWVEVWVESDSLAGTLVNLTWNFGVPLFSGRGFSSLTSGRDAAQQIWERGIERGQTTSIFYVGDLDPAGWEMSKSSLAGLGRHMEDMGVAYPEEFFSWDRIAVNPLQVAEYDLPTGDPPKASGPGSSTWWKKDGPRLPFTVDAEAFDPPDLRALVESHIMGAADMDALRASWATQRMERETLIQVANSGLPFKQGRGNLDGPETA